MATRRSTRLRSTASAEPPELAHQPNVIAAVTTSRALTKKTTTRATKAKGKAARGTAATTRTESTTVTKHEQSHRVTKPAARAPKAKAAAAVTTKNAASGVRTRAAKALSGSPLYAGVEAEPSRKRSRGKTRSEAREAERTEPEPQRKNVQDEEEDDDESEIGLFFQQTIEENPAYDEEDEALVPTFIRGSESAIALLNKIENAAKESRGIKPAVQIPVQEDRETTMDDDNDVTMEPAPQPTRPDNRTTQVATPARPIATPTSFFSKSFSALKSLFATPKPEAPAPQQTPPSTTRPRPTPNSFTETLSLPPTPVGERVRTPARKSRTDIMLQALLQGVEAADRAKAEEWAKSVIPTLKNDPKYRSKRKRLQTPVLLKDLDELPTCKPWESGFGDPLGDLDDDDVVPAWAVYLDMMTPVEEPETKKTKTTHEVTDDNDVMSLNDQYGTNNNARPVVELYNSHGNSSSLLDLQPRRCTDPAPMFAKPASHQKGSNLFSELQGHDSAAKIRETERENLQSSLNKSPNSNAAFGRSFCVPDDSDSEGEDSPTKTPAKATPGWTQAPPPAPVPAHAALPATSDDASSGSAAQAEDEVDRQRKLALKHTPAKPSRLREATYPSPSLLSDAGNESIIGGTPARFSPAFASLFAGMPTAVPLDIDADTQAAADAIVESEAFKMDIEQNPWPTAIVEYESDEEELSPQ